MDEEVKVATVLKQTRDIEKLEAQLAAAERKLAELREAAKEVTVSFKDYPNNALYQLHKILEEK